MSILFEDIKYYLIKKLLIIIYYLEIYFTFILNFFYNNFFNNNNLSKNKLIFVKNGKIIKKNNNLEKILYPKADYLVIKENFENDKTMDMIRVTNDNNFIINFNKKICNFKFILVTLISNDEKYDITNYLKGKNHTYYLVDAILFDKNFNNWICLNYLNKELNDIKIRIIDNNVNEIELSSNQFMKLKKK